MHKIGQVKPFENVKLYYLNCVFYVILILKRLKMFVTLKFCLTKRFCTMQKNGLIVKTCFVD